MQIRLRRATSTEFANTNIVLALGEPAYEADTGKLKIGDGTTAYNSLNYIGAGDLPDNVTTQGNTFNGAGQLVQLDSSGKLPAATVPANVVTTNDTTPLTIWRGTQTEYDSITTKDANTLYIITG